MTTHNSDSAPYSQQPGEGGETHQTTTDPQATLTTQQGAQIADNQNTLRAGVRGSALMEDHIMREKLFHFDHERIPERVVHARGYGAHGVFETYDNLSDITCADIFQRKGEKTPVFVRFSTVAGAKGSPDLARDVRGFAVKFYTKEGNWDLVGNNIPVFFIQDAIKFPDLIHAAKEAPDRAFPQAQTAHDNFWDFISLTPESMHMVMWAMSDRAIPRSLRFMEGFGVHTFRFVNAQGATSFVKFHWKPVQGLQSVTWDEALKINGADPDFHRRDLWSAIERGDYPEWELGVQVFDEAFAESFDFDVLDATKLIPEELVPVKIIGKMTLNKNVENFFAETEQVAFCTSNIVKGIDQSEDPLLQGRNFSYLDTQLKRLGGPNFTNIPINAPKCPMHHFQQDGHMTMNNPKTRANYEPNSWGDQAGPRENPEKGFTTAPIEVSGNKVRARSETFADHYSQAGQFYRSQTPLEQQHIADAITFELSKVEREDIRIRVVGHLLNINSSLAVSVAEQLGIQTLPDPIEPAKTPKTDLPVSDALSILKQKNTNFSGRKVGIVLSNGIDQSILNSLITAIEKLGATYELIAPTVGGAKDASGKIIKAHQMIGGAPSVLYDAVAIIAADNAIDELTQHPAAISFLMDAFNHGKYIAYTPSVKALFDAANLTKKKDDGCVELDNNETEKSIQAFTQQLPEIRFWKRM